MLSDKGSRLTVPLSVLHAYYARHPISCLSRADGRAQTIPRRAVVVEKYLWISEAPKYLMDNGSCLRRDVQAGKKR